MSALEDAITICGSQSELARRIGGKVRTGHIHYWLRNKVPADRCAAIEKATGGQVTCEMLRPEVFGARASTQREAS